MKKVLYVMDADGTVRQTQDKAEFLSFMEDNNKKILLKENLFNVCEVVTSFLGVDTVNTDKKQKLPMIFETEVLDGPVNGAVRKYPSYKKALEGHREIVNMIKLQIN